MFMLLKSLKVYAKMDLLWLLRDTKYCILQIFADIVSVISTVLALMCLAMKFENIGGFSYYQLLLMFGIATSVHGIYNMFFANYNNGMVSRIIGRGQIEHYIIQPIPIWIQIITRGFAPFSGNSQFFLSIVLIVFSLKKLGILSTVMMGKVLAVSVISVIMMVSIIYMVSTVAFYAPSAAEDISQPILALFVNTSYFPLGSMDFICKLLYTFIIPVGSIAWFPTKVILENNIFSEVKLLLAPIVAIALANLFFRKGLNYYAKKGAGRYSSFGHR